MPSSHLILCRPFLLLPPIPPSIKVFYNESTLPMRWPNYWTFTLSISPSNEHSGLISFRMHLLDLLAVQGTLMSLLQHQFKSIISSALSFLYSPTFCLTSMISNTLSSRLLIHPSVLFSLLLISSSLFFISVFIFFIFGCYLYFLTLLLNTSSSALKNSILYQVL